MDWNRARFEMSAPSLFENLGAFQRRDCGSHCTARRCRRPGRVKGDSYEEAEGLQGSASIDLPVLECRFRVVLGVAYAP